jgi:hypothetical protein
VFGGDAGVFIRCPCVFLRRKKEGGEGKRGRESVVLM